MDRGVRAKQIAVIQALCEYKQDPAMAAETIHALKVLIDRNGKHVFGEAIQMHQAWV